MHPTKIQKVWGRPPCEKVSKAGEHSEADKKKRETGKKRAGKRFQQRGGKGESENVLEARILQTKSENWMGGGKKKSGGKKGKKETAGTVTRKSG